MVLSCNSSAITGVLILILVCLNMVYCVVQELIDYNPLIDKGYKPKSKWHHFSPRSEISASVADFVSKSFICVRLVVFTTKSEAILGRIETSCHSRKLSLGLIHIGDSLWYYGMAMARHSTIESQKQGEKSSSNYIFIHREKDDLTTCKKTIFNDEDLFTDPKKLMEHDLGHIVKSDGPEADLDCKDLVELNIPPMKMLSAGEGNQKYPESKFSPSSSFNSKEIVGAETKVYMDGFVCFRLLQFYSKGRPLLSMRMACGPLQGVVMTERAFYYGKTAMIKALDENSDKFTIFIDRSDRNIHSEDDYDDSSVKCQQFTFRLITNGHSYKIKKVATVLEYELGTECKHLIDGKFQGRVDDDGRMKELANPYVDSETLKKLDGYTVASKPSDFNLMGELGAVILYFKRREPEDFVRVISVLSRGTVLTGAITGVESHTEDLTIRNDKLYHNRDLVAKKDSQGKVTIAINNENGTCTKKTYVLNSSGDKFSKGDIENVDVKDPDCNFLLEATHANPGGN